MTFGTDGQETPIAVADAAAATAAKPVDAVADDLNTGFCLDYQER